MPRNQAGRLVREAGPRSWPRAPGPWPREAGPWSWPLAPGSWPPELAPSFIVQKALYTFDKPWRSMGNTKLCSVCNPDSFRISFCIQKVSGDLHYLLAKRLVNTFWFSSLMNVNLVSPEVFFFNLHLLKVLKLRLYRTKAQVGYNKEGT